MAMFDVNAVEAEAQRELAEERTASAQVKIKDKLAQIARAEKVVQNLKLEYQALIADIALEA
jgi:hypothetical protein